MFSNPARHQPLASADACVITSMQKSMPGTLAIGFLILLVLWIASAQHAKANPTEQRSEVRPTLQLRDYLPEKQHKYAGSSAQRHQTPPVKQQSEAGHIKEYGPAVPIKQPSERTPAKQRSEVTPTKEHSEAAPQSPRHEPAQVRSAVAQKRSKSETTSRRRHTEPSSEYEPNFVKPTMEYDDIIDPSKKRTISSMLSAEFAVRARRADRAIELARRAMKRDPDDIEIHKALAEALDLKLEEQTEKDPRIFEECIKEYLIVMRNGVGMEKGTNFRGMGVLDHMFGDEELHFMAKARLKFLTGYAPKPWESNEKYLKRVLHPAQTNVKGRILKHSD